MKKEVCRITTCEAIQFERHGLVPNCANHDHINRHHAMNLLGTSIASAEARLVGHHYDPETKKSCTFIVDLAPRVWKPRNRVLQLVKGVVAGKRGQFHYPVEAEGARGRRTTVADTNEPPELCPSPA